MVVDRVKEFLSSNKNGSIETTISPLSTEKRAVVSAKVTLDNGRVFTGHSQAEYGSGNMGGVALEVAETSAVGRALGFAGIGLLDGIASADEMRKVGKRQTYNDKNKQDKENGADPLLDNDDVI